MMQPCLIFLHVVSLGAEEALLAERFTAERAGEGMAVKGSAMWTMVWTPAEHGPISECPRQRLCFRCRLPVCIPLGRIPSKLS